MKNENYSSESDVWEWYIIQHFHVHVWEYDKWVVLRHTVIIILPKSSKEILEILLRHMVKSYWVCETPVYLFTLYVKTFLTFHSA